MDDIQKEAIRRSRIYLVEKLIPETLWDHLLAKKIFTDAMLEYIKVAEPRSERIRKLISDLLRRPKEAYEDFITCLIECGHEHCANEIRKNEIEIRMRLGELSGVLDNSPHSFTALRTTQVQPPEQSPPQSPSQFASNPQQESNSSHDVHMQQDSESAYAHHMRTERDNVYIMKSNPRGYVFIINNHKFTNFEDRNGTKVDCDQLKELFSTLGYRVCDDTDLTAELMKKRLIEFSKHPENKDADSLIVVILSHGEQDDKIFGIDGCCENGRYDNYITTNDLKDWFGNRQCPELQDKPKLFVIQACRGSSEDRCNSASSTGSTLSTDIHPEGLSSKEGPFVSSFESSRPNQCDMIFAYSSIPGHVSYRHCEEGSVFIQALVSVFKEACHKEHLSDLLTMVNKKISEVQTEEGKLCLASPVNQLTKKWFFNV